MFDFSETFKVNFSDVITVILAAGGAIVAWIKASKAKESEEQAKKYLYKIETYYSEAAEYYQNENKERRYKEEHPYDEQVLEYINSKGDVKAKGIANNLNMSIEDAEAILNRLFEQRKIRKNTSYWHSIK